MLVVSRSARPLDLETTSRVKFADYSADND